MAYESVEEFKKNREDLNEIVLRYAGKGIKRFFNLDTNAYQEGALPAKTKEMLGLVASAVLRCDDCIKYHIIRCFEEGVADEELEETLSISLIVGGSIVIPHLRRAFKAWEDLKNMEITSKSVLFKRLMVEIDSFLGGEETLPEKLKLVCQLLADKVSHYDWVGFYLVNPQKEKELILDAYVGDPTGHTHIAFGQGICGQAADRKETFLIQDVSKEDNYLSCSINVKSEIVVPIMRGDEVLGELDIDSHALAPFGDDDRKFLEDVCEKLAKLF